MPVEYRVIEIFTSEEARWEGEPLPDSILKLVQKRRLAARCLISRAIAGCYENGEMATYRLLEASYNLPLKIEIVLPAAELEEVLPHLLEMVTDGIVAVEERIVYSHRTRRLLLPRHLRVRDAMTPQPKTISPNAPAREVIRLLLESPFNALPVVKEKEVVGIITQGDLLERLGMPLRLGLLRRLQQPQVEEYLNTLEGKFARDLMSQPVTVVREDQPLTEAVQKMLRGGLKRLPVVDEKNHLVGMLSRIDVLRAAASHAPDWERLAESHVVVTNVRTVADIVDRERLSLPPTATLEEVLRHLAVSRLQRVAVVAEDGKLLGIISDGDLLPFLLGERAPSLFSRLTKRLPTAKTAQDVMTPNPIACTESTPIEEAIRQMTTHHLKRLPVVDAEGRYAGMISREALLRAGSEEL